VKFPQKMRSGDGCRLGMGILHHGIIIHNAGHRRKFHAREHRRKTLPLVRQPRPRVAALDVRYGPDRVGRNVEPLCLRRWRVGSGA